MRPMRKWYFGRQPVNQGARTRLSHRLTAWTGNSYVQKLNMGRPVRKRRGSNLVSAAPINLSKSQRSRDYEEKGLRRQLLV